MAPRSSHQGGLDALRDGLKGVRWITAVVCNARPTPFSRVVADVVILLRGEYRRFLPTKLAMADVCCWKRELIFRPCRSGWTNGSIRRLSRILGCCKQSLSLGKGYGYERGSNARGKSGYIHP